MRLRRIRLNCSETFIKVFLFISTFLIFLTGVALMGVGIWIRVDPTAVRMFLIAGSSNDQAELLSAAATFIAVIGSILMVIGFFGCCGAWKQSTWLLFAFAICVGMMSAMQIAAGAVILVNFGRLGPYLKSAMQRQIWQRYDGVSQLAKAWDGMQVYMECCGADKPQDWALNEWRKPPGYGTPRSCCVLRVKDHRICCLDDSNIVNVPGCKSQSAGAIHVEGCYTRVRDWFQKNSGLLLALAFGLLLVQALAIFASCWLARRISYREEEQIRMNMSMNTTLNTTRSSRYPSAFPRRV